MIELTNEQKQVYDKILDFVKARDPLLTFGGYVGVGKTTVVGQVAEAIKGLNLKIAFCAISGKASTVLRAKLRETLTEDDYCGTIHSLIYMLVGKEQLRSGRQELHFERARDTIPYDLIIVDEASMVTERIFRDLSHFGIPILAVGDHGQLPPVKGNFNLMAKPEIKLETIIRQAEGNPIIHMARLAREYGRIEFGDYGSGCIKTNNVKVLHDHKFADIDSIMLCGTNRTRTRMNSFAREILKRNNPCPEMNVPIVGEPVICLYNNNRKKIFNGNIGIIENIECDPSIAFMEVDFGDFTFTGDVDLAQFGKEYVTVEEKDENLDYFDWAYAITTHKAQGSEWRSVLLIEERIPAWDDATWRKWLYTAVTRAKERLIIFKR